MGIRFWPKDKPFDFQEKSIREINVSLAVIAGALKQVALDVDILRNETAEILEWKRKIDQQERDRHKLLNSTLDQMVADHDKEVSSMGQGRNGIIHETR